MTGRDTHSGVLLPPPLLYLGAFLLAWLLKQGWPLPFPDGAWNRWLGFPLLAAGLVFNAWGAWTMLRARTPINPYRPVTSLLTNGPFRISRNPLYVGLDLVYLGVALVTENLWTLLFLAPLLVVLHHGVVRREERHLEARFGDEYRHYRREVRRYL